MMTVVGRKRREGGSNSKQSINRPDINGAGVGLGRKGQWPMGRRRKQARMGRRICASACWVHGKEYQTFLFLKIMLSHYLSGKIENTSATSATSNSESTWGTMLWACCLVPHTLHMLIGKEGWVRKSSAV